MTISIDILLDGLGRVRETVHQVVPGLTPEQLTFQLDEETNTVAWLVWHLARVQDDHISSAAGTAQVWQSAGWEKRFRLPFEQSATGYGQSADEVAAVRVDSGELLTGYYDAVHERTIEYVTELEDSDLATVIDDSWDPPVTVAMRVVSVINDCTQHVGQAAFLRGVILRQKS